jgi:Plasmid replication region DNA-binding N-term
MSRGITQSDVSHAADSRLRAGERPTIEKIRAKLRRGSPNTINPMLDTRWKTLSARLDSGPATLHRLPESIAHIADALWMQALEEGKRRALLEQRDSSRVAELDKHRLEVRSHVLTLREGELDSRLRDRDRTIEELNLRLRELTVLLSKEQATRESPTRRLATPALLSWRAANGHRDKQKPEHHPGEKGRRLPDAPPPSENQHARYAQAPLERHSQCAGARSEGNAENANVC